jgi:nitric oxide reductase NorQ protein
MPPSTLEQQVSTQPYYRIIGKEKEIFHAAYKNRLPILLKGPTGTGKSRFVEHMAHEVGLELITVACHEETSATDLIGRFILKGTETVWQDGPLTQAAKEGSILYLDEVAEARPDIIVAIHSLTDHRRMLYIDKLGKSIKAHEDFMLVTSFNPGYQKGFKELKPSTRQRFVALAFTHPEQGVEIEILMQETGVDKSLATKLVKIAGKIRNLTELGLTETVSTRLIIDAAKLINTGLGKRTAVQAGMIQPLTDDDEVLKTLIGLSDLMI